MTLYLSIGAVVVVLALFLYKDVWVLLRPGYLRVYVSHTTREITRHYCKIGRTMDKETLTIGNIKYNVENERVYRMGLFRVPTAFYVHGKATPRNMLGVTSNETSGLDYHEATESHIASDVIKLFLDNRISSDMAFAIEMVAILGGMAILWYFLNAKLDKILSAVTGVIS